MRLRIAALALGMVGTGACAQVIGADFSGFSGQESSGGAAGSSGTGGDDARSAGDGSAGMGGQPMETGGGGSPAMGGASGTGGAMGTGGSMGTGGAAGNGGAMGGSGGQSLADAADGPNHFDASIDAPSNDGAHDGGPIDEGARPDAAVDAADASAGTLVINEIRAVDQDWIELYNPGSEAVDLSGRGLTQARGTNGPPDPTALLLFPNGASLAPGAFLFIFGKQAARGGPFSDCGGFASSCYWVDWGVSASGGEAVYLVVASTLAPTETVAYPVTNAPPAGRSYGRFPDGTGPFMSTAPTPNAANQL